MPNIDSFQVPRIRNNSGCRDEGRRILLLRGLVSAEELHGRTETSGRRRERSDRQTHHGDQECGIITIIRFVVNYIAYIITTN